MKNDMMRRAIGGIDSRLIEQAEKEGITTSLKESPVKKERIFRGKKAVFAALALVVVFCAVLVVSAVVANMTVYQDEQGYRIHYEGSEDEVDIHSVTVGYVPEGYVVRELTEAECENDPEGSGFDPRIRQIRLIREDYADLSAYELANTPAPQIVINVNRAGEIDWGYSYGTYEMTYQSTINGMDAIMIHKNDASAEEHTNIQFSDDKITVNVRGHGLSMDEVVKVAENIAW